jgi:hypothetical protein
VDWFYTDQREFGSHRSMSTLAARKFVALYRYGTNKEKAPWGQSAFGGKSARRVPDKCRSLFISNTLAVSKKGAAPLARVSGH